MGYDAKPIWWSDGGQNACPGTCVWYDTQSLCDGQQDTGRRLGNDTKSVCSGNGSKWSLTYHVFSMTDPLRHRVEGRRHW